MCMSVGVTNDWLCINEQFYIVGRYRLLFYVAQQ